MAEHAALASAWRAAGALGQRLDAWRFGAERGDYYEYLADMLEGLQGRQTLRDIFETDAARHGEASVRGRLARRWLHRYQDCGGDLRATWARCLPEGDCTLLALAQAAGGGALGIVLRDLAHLTRLTQGMRREFCVTIAAGLVAMTVACALLAAVPAFSAPRLRLVFQAVPPDYHGAWSAGLFALARYVEAAWSAAVAALTAAVALVCWSLPRYAGRARVFLDRWQPWRLYRDMQAIRFLALATVLLRQRGQHRHAPAHRAARPGGRRAAVAGLAPRAHAAAGRRRGGRCQRVRYRAVRTRARPGSWPTWSPRMAWPTAWHGRARGSRRTCCRACGRQAQGLRWALLLGAVGAVLALALWHYAAIDDLRHALVSFYASQ
ncbi:general secretion pathway protein [Bordetella pertussis]|nr:general secretion pathway protein [Bordetella pertussis]VTP83720.1 general secretion pathway protein [Bordetella pertussis]